MLLTNASQFEQEEEAAHAQFEEANKNKADAWKLLKAEHEKPQYNSAEAG